EAGVTVVEGSGTLYVNNSNAGRHQGVYRCYASNDLGTAMGPEIRVIAESTPQWPKEKVLPLEVEEGESVILPCNPPASAMPPKIYWLNSRIVHIAQDERVSMGQDGYLYFANVRRSDSHPDYICHAHYLGPRTIIQKEPIELRVRPTNSVKFRQPRLMVPPGESSSHVALRGSSLALECIAEGFPTPTVEWIRLNGRLPAERVALENSQKTLRIRDVVEEDDGEYQCLARNTQGTARHTYTVTVEAAPYWAQQPHSRVYGPGENVRLDCSVYGKPNPLVSWRINGLAPDPTRTLRSGALILSQVQPNDSLVTQCEAVNHHGRLLANAYIYVIQLPARILTPDKQRYAVVENQTASLDCQTFGAPMPSVEWFTGRMEPALQDERAFVHTNGSLRLPRAQRQDTGTYVCLAQNDQTNVTISAWLEVKGATRIELGPQSAVVKKSSNVTFQCLVRFDETLQERGVEWWRDGRPIRESDDSDKYTIEPGWLRISGVDYTDQGVYSCRAHTELDAVEESAELRVVELQVSEPQERWVKLSWTPGDDHNSPIEKFVVEAEDGLRDPGTWRDVSTVPGHQPWAQLHLVPYGDFRFRVRAANRFGRGEPSAASAPVRTSPAAPERYPEGVAGEGNETNNMLITWKPLNRSDWNAPDLSYRVQWRRLGKGGGWSEETVSGPPLLVTRTPTFVPYEIKVQAVNPIGKGPEPPTVVGYSGEDGEWGGGLSVTLPRLPPSLCPPVPSPPSSLLLERVSDTVLALEWTAPQFPNGALTEYLLQYQQGESRGRWAGGHKGWNRGSYGWGGLAIGQVQDGYWLDPTPSGEQCSRRGKLRHTQASSPRVLGPGAGSLGNAARRSAPPVLTTDQRSFATEGWFIGFICAVVLLLLLLLILCFVKRSKGGKYSVKDKEDIQVDSEARPMKDETFGEYSDNEEKPFGSSQPSLNGALPALGSEDSLADYGGSVDVQFNEDGSFIGQYSGHTGKEPAGNNSSGATSPTTATAALE
uniref:Uncharacterized protein n=1 Tax=Gopherus agassizii TaxID=38772 RepID=A0A452HLB7_9SAUR